jgi:hypothetical protein
MTVRIRRTIPISPLLLATFGIAAAAAAAAAPTAPLGPHTTPVASPRSFDLSRATVTRTPFTAPDEALAPLGTAATTAQRALPPGDRTYGFPLPYGPSLSTAGDLNGTGFCEQLIGLPVPGAGGSVKVLYRTESTLIQTLNNPALPGCFGNAVASADVNGDGFQDVIVGDPQQGASSEGAIFIYHGSAFGIAGLPTTSRHTGGPSANFGYSVSYAGDVNGDGYDDVIVGAPGWADDQYQEGAAYLYLGGATGLAASPVWHAEGVNDFAWLGFDVSTAGDVDGDGYDDLVVGEPLYTGGEFFEGRVHLYLGGPTGIQPSSDLPYESNVASARLGWSVATAGDANADGYADWAAGAPLYTNVETNEGAVYLFQGANSPFLAPPPIVDESNRPSEQLGFDLACGGDFNGDGLADLIAGRPGHSNANGTVGGFDVLLGFSDLTAWPFPGNFNGTVPFGGFGSRVAIGGDVNGDGFSDPLTLEHVPFPTAPESPPAPPSIVEVHGFSLAILGFGLRDEVAAGPFMSETGWSLAIGDVNGDGYDDLVTGGRFGLGGTGAGVLQMYLGHPGGLGNVPALPLLFPPADWTYFGTDNGSMLGSSVACADVNGDGYDDILAGAPDYTDGMGVNGKTIAFYGSPGGPSVAPDWVVHGGLNDVGFGWSTANAGDVNGDGFADVLVGAPFGNFNTGRAYLYYGSALGLSKAPARTYVSAFPDGHLGECVAGLGDVDGDGYDDFGIGNPGYGNGETGEGAVLVYRGAPAGPGAVFDAVESNESMAGLGRSFCGAGDVNGDGKADLLCGLPTHISGFPGEGRLLLYYGSASGFPTNANWTLDGGQPSLYLGFSVSTAGDVNGDGLSDFIAGLPLSYAQDGSAQVFLGSTTLPTIFPVLELFEGAGGQSGQAVVGGGDFNGDGLGDVAMGSPRTTVGKGNMEGTVQYLLAGVLQPNQLVHRPVDAYRPNADTPISPGLRSDAANGYRLRGRMRTVGGRGRVRTEAETKPNGVAFNGVGTVKSAWLKTPRPTAGDPNTLPFAINFTGLTANTKHHWRARYVPRSPLLNASHWMSPQQNGMTQGDVRTAGGEFVVDVPPTAGDSPSLALAGARPNPASALAPTSFAFSLPRAGRVRLVLHDATGRRVRALLDRDAAAGPGAVAWDLRDDAGARVAAGVYFARLVFEGEARESKVVVLP